MHFFDGAEGRRRARRHRFTSAAVAGALVASCSLLAAGAPVGASAGQEPGSWAVPEDRGEHVPGLAGSLQDDAREGAPVHPAGLPEHATDAPPNRVTVVVETTDVEAASDAVAGAGGTVRTTTPGLVKADVPASSLEALVSARGVTYVREPYRPVPQATSEGVGYSRAEPWHEAGWIGTGTKVAVVDGGFAGYAGKVGSELPAGTTTDFSRCNGLPGASEHGTAVAEIVHDMAPGAELLLVCIEDDVDFVNRMAAMQAAGVDIVNGSFGFSLTGRGDGSGGPGTVARAVADLRAQGILYVAAAGNYGQHHFHTAAVGDAPVPDNGDFVNISPDDALLFHMPAGGIATIAVSWDAWPTTRQDFDIYVGNDACGLLGASTADQAGGPLPPVEYLVFESCTAGPATYELIVDRYSGTATPRLDIWFDGDIGWVEHTTRSSVVEPASSPAVMAVGAHCATQAIRQSYSSQGPTIDGRTKPDISGPDATSGSVYGPSLHCSSGFTGTSASAPHVTGGAALVLGANPDLEVAELQQLLEDKARDAGTPPGEDNDYGAGILDLRDPGSAAVSAAQPFTPHGPVRLLDSRPTATGASEGHPGLGAVGTPIGPRGMLRIPVVGVAGVPADATAAVLNVTAVSPTAGGYLTVYPDGPRPLASNINFAAKQVVAVAVTATIADDGWITIFNSAGSTHVVVDLTGWYGPTGTGGPATDGFQALPAPKRALNTQPTQTGYAEGAFGPKGATTRLSGNSIAIQVAGLGGVPDDAQAVVVNLATVQAQSGGHLTIYPDGIPLPRTSALNFAPGQTIANLAIVPVGSGGRIRVHSQGTTDVVVDVVGSFRPGVGAGYVALDPPVRRLNTQTGTSRLGALGHNATYRLPTAHYEGVPTDAHAVWFGVGVVRPTAGGYLTVYPGTATRPFASNINFTPGIVIANAVVSGVGADGTVAFTNSAGSSHLAVDLAGYFIDPALQPVPLAEPPAPPPPPPG